MKRTVFVLLAIVGIMLMALCACGGAELDSIDDFDEDITAAFKANQQEDAPAVNNEAAYGKTLVAQPLGGSGESTGGIPTDKPAAETLLFYADGLEYGEASPNNTKRLVTYSFKGQSNDIDSLKAYAKMLSENGFTPVDSFEKSYEMTGDTFGAYALDYSGRTLHGKSEMSFKDGVEADITAWWGTDGGSLKGGISYSDEIALGDFGLRMDGSRQDMSYAGDSAAAGLYRQGSAFETDDGRLHANFGEAMVVCDGTAYSVKAQTKRITDRLTTIFAADVGNGSDAIGVILPDYAQKSGQMFETTQIDSGESYFRLMCNYPHADLVDAMSCSNWKLGFGVAHNGKYFCPCETIETGIVKVFLRVLYGDDSVMVCYAAAEFDTAPYKVEMLGAFDMTNVTEGDASGSGSDSGYDPGTLPAFTTDDTCIVCKGTGNKECLRCSGSGKIDCQECGGDGWENLGLSGEILCKRCHGSTKEDCPTCYGRGTKPCSGCGGDGKR